MVELGDLMNALPIISTIVSSVNSSSYKMRVSLLPVTGSAPFTRLRIYDRCAEYGNSQQFLSVKRVFENGRTAGNIDTVLGYSDIILHPEYAAIVLNSDEQLAIGAPVDWTLALGRH